MAEQSRSVAGVPLPEVRAVQHVIEGADLECTGLVDEPTASLDPKTSRQIMRLIRELCEERGLAAIINIHDVALAQMFVPRIVGLRMGEIVFDGPPAGLTSDKLTEIYGEEDWEATIRRVEEEEEAA